MTSISGTMVRAATIVLFLLLWEVSSQREWVDSVLLPPATEVLSAGIRDIAVLLNASWYSLLRVLGGIVIATTLGILFGIIMATSAKAEDLLAPIVELVRPIPPVAWIPVIIIWIGIGNGGPIAIIAIGAFFPVLLNTITGVRAVDGTLINLYRTLGASRLQLMLDVIIPSALPSIIAGLRVSIGIGWASVVAAEMFGANSGLGYQIQYEANFLHTAEVIATMVWIGIIGLLLDQIVVNLASRRWLAWATVSQLQAE